MTGELKQAETFSTGTYQVRVKWSKILSGGKRLYRQCYGPPFIIQISGSGLVAPCGMLFNQKYSRYHIGNVAEQRFKDIWMGERYWEVMRLIGSESFNAQTMCGTLCLQHNVNELLWNIRRGTTGLVVPQGVPPPHINFI
jgi:MoaA/NifB/PqqE/SkfB family radical SAM enzyme